VHFPGIIPAVRRLGTLKLNSRLANCTFQVQALLTFAPRAAPEASCAHGQLALIGRMFLYRASLRPKRHIRPTCDSTAFAGLMMCDTRRAGRSRQRSMSCIQPIHRLAVRGLAICAWVESVKASCCWCRPTAGGASSLDHHKQSNRQRNSSCRQGIENIEEASASIPVAIGNKTGRGSAPG